MMPDTNKDHARKVARSLAQHGDQTGGILTGIWHWVNGVASGINHFLQGAITGNLVTIGAAIHQLFADGKEYYQALWRVYTWVDRHILAYLLGVIRKLQNRTDAKLAALRKYLVGLIFITTQTVLVLALRAVRQERQARIREVGQAEARAVREIKAARQLIEREAVSGYRIEYQTRVNVLVRLLEYAALRNPLVRRLAEDIATGVLDLASVDNPIARLLLSFLIKQVIDRLGIDRELGVWIDDLLKPLLGEPKPKGLHDVINDLSLRVGALERQWSHFMADGGAQVEEAGSKWRDITSIVTDVALIGFIADAMIDPAQWAHDINSLVGNEANDLALKALQLFGG